MWIIVPGAFFNLNREFLFCFTLFNSLLCICFGCAASLLPCLAFSGLGEGAVCGRAEGALRSW